MTRRRPHLLSHLPIDAAERSPDSPALVDGEVRIDQAALADRVARAGAALRARGVGSGDRVLVVAPKSADSFVAVHAALHAGAVAVPVNPQAPATHLAAVVHDVAPAAIVVHPATVDRLPSDPALLVGDAGDRTDVLSWAEIAATDPVGPAPRTGHDPAYLITTSGSTGRPKAIVHTHASGLRYAELAADCYGLQPDDRMANVAPFHFDQSTFELYAGPLVGAAVVLVSEILVRFPASVSELLEREAVTTWYSVPTILRQLLERGALETRDLPSLRWVLFGGEVFPGPVLARLMAQLPGARFSNVYGPAEVNQCTFHHLDGPPIGDEPVPIGRAWDDTELRLVDGDRIVTGPGRGELLVRSTTAMAGYWNRPDLDRAAFVSEAGPGGVPRRWYRTGDVVERSADGTLVFAGRTDRQVKVRGIRLELEAVEAAMTAVEGVTAGAAIVVDDPDAPLVGLVESTTLDDVAPVRRALAAALPPGAAPDRIVVVPVLPRTGSGKVDVKAAAGLVEAEVTA